MITWDALKTYHSLQFYYDWITQEGALYEFKEMMNFAAENQIQFSLTVQLHH